MALTKLSARKQAVLSAIIKAYIDTGEPVGSKILTGLIENAPSSATLRNEMNELCLLGLLKQPHTSAGRVPTSEGYRLYVNTLMKPMHLSENVKQYIDRSFKNDECDPRLIAKKAADVLSELTGLPAFSCYFADKEVYLKKVGLIPAGKKAVVLFIVTSDGRTLSRLCRLSCGYSERISSEFERIFTSKLKRKPLIDFDRAGLQGIVANAGINAFELTPVLSLLYNMIEKMNESNIAFGGTAHLYNLLGEEGARRVLSIAEHGDYFVSRIHRSSGKTEVLFGEDIGIPELYRSTLVLSDFYIKNKYCGRIGLIGNGRMFYEQIIPSIEYTASKLTHYLSEASKDMED